MPGPISVWGMAVPKSLSPRRSLSEADANNRADRQVTKINAIYLRPAAPR